MMKRILYIRKLSEHKIVFFFISIRVNICLVTQKNSLIETVLFSTLNIYFSGKIRKIVFRFAIKKSCSTPLSMKCILCKNVKMPNLLAF